MHVCSAAPHSPAPCIPVGSGAGAMRQRILGSHTPPCHRRMVITTLSSMFCLAALQRKPDQCRMLPCIRHSRWLSKVLRLFGSARTHHPPTAPVSLKPLALRASPGPADMALERQTPPKRTRLGMSRHSYSTLQANGPVQCGDKARRGGTGESSAWAETPQQTNHIGIRKGRPAGVTKWGGGRVRAP